MKTNNLFYDYYDVLFKDKNYASEARLVLKLAQKQGLTTVKKLLEIGCGTGNHTLQFAQKIPHVTALDIDLEMLKIARPKLKHNTSIRLVHAPVETLTEKNFDLAIALFFVISYVTSYKQLTSLFTATHKRLRTDATFIFDMWNGIASLISPPKSKTTTITHDGLTLRCVLNPSTNLWKQETKLTYSLLVTNKNKTKTDSFSFSMHLWTPQQIESAAYTAGFRHIYWYPWMNIKRIANEKDWKLMCVLQK